MIERKNVNWGFKKLRVWDDAVELYILTCKHLIPFPYELKKVSANCIDAAQSISRNIAEGYSRKSLKEYLYFCNIALGSSGEYHSCICSFLRAGHITDEVLESIDDLHFKMENELIQLIKSLQVKLKQGNWDDQL
ncbi:MAG: four helix bundle protein [Bacteroidota bacterium]